MKLIIFVLSILRWDMVKGASETCSYPDVRRADVHIFRSADVDVTVYRCYTPSHSDITKNCINAFNTGLFIDKWAQEYYTNVTDSTTKFEKYTAKSNILQNKIRLRSGTVCRYDRGFCYDPKESINFAVVWEVTHEKPDIDPKNLIEIFYGQTDVWWINTDFSHLILQDQSKDLSFALRIRKSTEVDGNIFWYTDQDGMIMSQGFFKQNKTVFWDREYFSLKSKQFVSERLLKTCDLRNFPLDLENYTHENYVLDQNHVVVILDIFQKQLLETNKKLDITSKENCMYNKTVNELQMDLTGTKTSLLTKDREIVEIQNVIKNMLSNLQKKDSDVLKLQREIEKLLVKQEVNDVELGKIRERLVASLSQLTKLRDGSNEKNVSTELAKLQNNFTLLEATLLEKNAKIFEALYSKGKLINDVQNSLFNLYGELQNKDIELQMGQKNISNQLSGIELDINRQNDDIMEFRNYTNLILTRNQNDFTATAREFNKIELKYNDILGKLNLHDTEISKCQNYTTFLLSNKLLEIIEDNNRKTQGAVLQLERNVRDLLDKNIVLEKNISKIDGITRKLKENVTHSNQKILVMVNENNNEMKVIKEKSEQCRRAVDGIMNGKDEDSNDVQKNLTSVQNILAKQDEILKEIHNKLDENDKHFTEAINDCKRHVNASRQLKDEEMSRVQDKLIEKDAEIKKNYEYFKKMNEECKDIKMKLKEKDDEVRRILNNLIIRDEEFRAELNKRDQEYKRLEEKVKKIDENIQTVEAN